MKKSLLSALLLTLLSVTACQTQPEVPDTPTGYASDEIDQPQLMYENERYYYSAAGFDQKLPDGYLLVGEVGSVDDKHEPVENFAGSRLEVGQKIYADETDKDSIYVQYGDGYAEFVRPASELPDGLPRYGDE
ncbi:hypothetical protein GPL15_21140 [Clostridium sp. MCC353]|nr:hypothetical protein [Clostridium sp. MCC353]